MLFEANKEKFSYKTGKIRFYIYINNVYWRKTYSCYFHTI